MNPDKVPPGRRCASSSNCNFVGPEGPRARTHLVSPAMAAAAAVTGRLADVRELMGRKRAVPVMEPVRTVEGPAYPFGRKNVDTDLIIPARWLKTMSRSGLGRGAFEALRDDPANLFDEPRYAGAPILIAGDNFGCGSSGEHAVRALAAWACTPCSLPPFSDIFASNAFKNGILTVVLRQEEIDRLMEVGVDQPIQVGLDAQTVTTPIQDSFTFAIDPFRKMCLMEGLDEIASPYRRQTRSRITKTRWRPPGLG